MNFPRLAIEVHQSHGELIDNPDLREHIGEPDLPRSEADGDRPKPHRASHYATRLIGVTVASLCCPRSTAAA